MRVRPPAASHSRREYRSTREPSGASDAADPVPRVLSRRPMKSHDEGGSVRRPFVFDGHRWKCEGRWEKATGVAPDDGGNPTCSPVTRWAVRVRRVPPESHAGGDLNPMPLCVNGHSDDMDAPPGSTRCPLPGSLRRTGRRESDALKSLRAFRTGCAERHSVTVGRSTRSTIRTRRRI